VPNHLYHGDTSIRAALDEPIETLAVNFWVRNWTDRPSIVPDIGREYLAFVPSHWLSSEADSSLRLALAALSLTVFGRLQGVDKAITMGQSYYGRAVRNTYDEIRHLGDVDVDELVLATMLMTHYEVGLSCMGQSYWLCRVIHNDENSIGCHL
jgi:hypothetical protein